MPLPDLDADGLLPPGIHAAAFAKIQARFGIGSPTRERQAELLRQIVEAAKAYPTIKCVLVWGSFTSSKPEPNDLDYSAAVSVGHPRTIIAPEHRRFIVPVEARQFYGVDKSYLVIPDYPLAQYTKNWIFCAMTATTKSAASSRSTFAARRRPVNRHAGKPQTTRTLHSVTRQNVRDS